MKKRIAFTAALLLAALLATPAAALEYTISGADGGSFGTPTSIETISVEAAAGMDRSKDGALLPPAFGSPSAGFAGSSIPLAAGAVTSGNVGAAVAVGYTAFSPELYYLDGSIGTLSIPPIGLNVRVYEGTELAALANGVGHFSGTSVWSGNVVLAGHNRGVNSYFGKIHTLSVGDSIALTTKQGTKTYAVADVFKISETDRSVLSATAADSLTLITCVSGQPEYRWCVRAKIQKE